MLNVVRIVFVFSLLYFSDRFLLISSFMRSVASAYLYSPQFHSSHLTCPLFSITGTYKVYASSAQATNTCVRSIIACIFPIVAHPIVANVGTEWGVSIFAFLSVGLLPIPVLFVRYGAHLRAHSKFAKEAEEVLAATRQREKALVEEAVIPPNAQTMMDLPVDEEKTSTLAEHDREKSEEGGAVSVHELADEKAAEFDTRSYTEASGSARNSGV